MSKVWHLQYLGHVGSIQWSCSLHYQTDLVLGENEPPASQVLDEADAKLTTVFRSACTTSNVVDVLRAREEVLDPAVEVPASGEKVIALAGNGGSSAFDLAPEMCVLIHRKTGAAIRSGHGWLHLPPVLSVSALGTAGDWNNAATPIAGANAFAALLDDDITHTTATILRWTLHPVVYSKVRRQRGADYTFQVTAATRATHPAWLRSRRK